MNLLYGSSFKPTGPSLAYDYKTLYGITSAAGYDETKFLASLQTTASLYRSLQANLNQVQSFNQLYKSYVPKTGSPMTADRVKLFAATSDPNYTQAAYVAAIQALRATNTKNVALSLALQTNPEHATNYVCLYGQTGNALDPAYLSSVTGTAGYTLNGFLNYLKSTADLCRALQGNTTKLESFNVKFGCELLRAGCPPDATRAVLMDITRAAGYDQTAFLQTLVPVPIFGLDSFWNTTLADNESLNPNSANLVTQLVAETKVSQPWFNTSKYSTGVYTVDSTVTAKVPVSIIRNGVTLSFTALHTLTSKGVPIPEGAVPAAGTDGHITILDTATDTLYEFWQLKKVNGQWQASWGGAIVNYSTSNGIMPIVTNAAGGREYWGATATGLPMVGGTIMLDELAAGVIPHVLAMSIPLPKNTYVYPATRTDGHTTGANNIPEGTIFRFPPDVVINPNWSPLIKMMVVAIRDYGVVVRDKAGCVTFYGEDPTQYGSTNPYTQYYGGKPLWDVMNQMPWTQLQATN